MKAKPSWRFFLTWLIAYTLLDILQGRHPHLAHRPLPLGSDPGPHPTARL